MAVIYAAALRHQPHLDAKALGTLRGRRQQQTGLYAIHRRVTSTWRRCNLDSCTCQIRSEVDFGTAPLVEFKMKLMVRGKRAMPNHHTQILTPEFDNLSVAGILSSIEICASCSAGNTQPATVSVVE